MVSQRSHWLAGRELRFPCFADPDHPEDYLRWVHDGNARAVSRADQPGGPVSEAAPERDGNEAL